MTRIPAVPLMLSLAGLIPFGNASIHAGPRRSWTADGDWPDEEVPPAVPGYKAWEGDLEEQRWCLGIRNGSSGEKDTPPSEALFPVILSVSSETDPEGQERFFIDTPSSCAFIPILPLDRNVGDLSSYVDAWHAHGENAGGRAMLWAERMLPPAWKAAWNAGNNTPADYGGAVRKSIILLTGSGLSATPDETRIFSETCTRLRGKEVSFYMIDYETPADMTSLMKECAGENGFYFRVGGLGDLKRSFSEIAHSLMTVRITALH